MDPQKDADRYYFLTGWLTATIRDITENPQRYQGYDGLSTLRDDIQSGLDSAEGFR